MMLLKKIPKYMFSYPETRDKLSLKWTGPVRIVKEKRPYYLIEYWKQGKMVTKWTPRANLRRTEQNQNDICNEQSNTLIPDKSSEESGEENITIPRCNNRYNILWDIILPQRCGNVYTHLVEICHWQLVPENWPYRGEGSYDLWRQTKHLYFYICF